MTAYDQQYKAFSNELLTKGKWVYNERTGKRCLTLPRYVMTYGPDLAPLLTLKACNVKKAFAEIVGYLRGYTSAAQFRALGTNTWDMNANETKAWLASPYRKGVDDCGLIYGALARNTPLIETTEEETYRFENDLPRPMMDQIADLFCKLEQGVDDRDMILNFRNPAGYRLGCLRPCMFMHMFNIVDGTIYLTSVQRSADVPLGLSFNSVQVYVMLAIAAKVSGMRMGTATHVIVNPHIYEDQLAAFTSGWLDNEPRPQATLKIDDRLNNLYAIENMALEDMYTVENYDPHPYVTFPFSA